MSFIEVPSVPVSTRSICDNRSNGSEGEAMSRSGGSTEREPISSPPRVKVLVDMPSPVISTPPRARLFRRNRDYYDHSTTYHYEAKEGWKAQKRNPQQEAKQMAWIQHLRQQVNQYK